MGLIWVLLLCVASWAQGGPKPAEEPVYSHIRVVLDTSVTMTYPQNDPQRLAILSTLLLYDLAHPTISTSGDRESFSVFPFAQSYSPAEQALAHAGPVLSAKDLASRYPSARQGLVQELGKLQYNGMTTYYYPGVRRAVDELKETEGGLDDRRIIVVLTDGIPDSPDDDLQRLLSLQPDLKEHRIGLYFIAFAKAAENPAFYESIVRPGSGEQFGEFWTAETGDTLTSKMIELFSYSFGYETEGPMPRTPGLSVDLAGGPDRLPVEAITVAFHPRAAVPDIKLSTPPGSRLNPLIGGPQGMAGSVPNCSCCSYRVIPYGHPRSGSYDVAPADGASFAVLRPPQITLETYLPPHGSYPLGAPVPAMAGETLPLEVFARPSSGSRGVTPALTVEYEVHLFERDGHASSGGIIGSRKSHHNNLVRHGLSTYAIEPSMSKAPFEDPELQLSNPYYEAVVVVEGKRGTVRIDDDELRVHVYPKILMQPDHPLRIGKGKKKRPLKKGERGCETFRFELLEGVKSPEGELTLPRLVTGDEYPIIARLHSATALQGPLAGATVNLSEPGSMGTQSLDVDGQPASSPWSRGEMIERDLLGDADKEFELCVVAGRPSEDATVTLEVEFVLDTPPYDRSEVILPLEVEVLLAGPTLFERFALLFLLLLLLALLGLVAFLLWPRLDLPPDLSYTVAAVNEGGAPPTMRSQRFPEQGFTGRFRRRGWYPIDGPGHGFQLGLIKPIREDLFLFEPHAGVLDGDGEMELSGDGAWQIVAHRAYTVRASNGSFQFRLEYTPTEGEGGV
jgi:hypothetical protein